VAVRLNTMVWGGIANPIIPVGEDAAAASELADRFSLDVLHPVVAEPQLREVVERFPHLRLPREISMHGLFQVVGDDEIGLATVRVLASHYYETVVRYGGGKSRAVWMNWKPTTLLRRCGHFSSATTAKTRLGRAADGRSTRSKRRKYVSTSRLPRRYSIA
jgi:hypothetical protein